MKSLAISAACLLWTAAGAVAAPYDGSTAMKCTIQTVLACSDATICVRGTAATVNLPPVLTVDVANAVISGAATGRTVQIMSVDRGSGKMILRGMEARALGVAWDLLVDETSGAMSGAVLSQGGYLLFGGCAAP
jgi:putative effector of murein hydrolase